MHQPTHPGQERRRPFVRTRVAGAGVLVMAGLTWFATAPGHAGPDPGQGSAQAQTDRIDPRAGSLSIGVTFGEAFAGHQNTEAKAESQAIDLGTVGTTLGSIQCDGKPPTYATSKQPQPLFAESGQPGADAGFTSTDVQGQFKKQARATTAPYAEAVTTTAPLSIAGTVAVGGGTSRSWSGLVKGQREAGASSDISSITFPGGISLSGLHWDVVFRTTGDNKQAGSFTIGHATIAGAPIPTNDPTATIEKINAALAPLGLQLDPPARHVTAGILFVDPLGISVVPSQTRDSIVGPAIGGIQPIRQPLTSAILEKDCELGAELTVVDVAVGALSGAGSFNLTLGGVQATSGTLAANNFNLAIPGAAGAELGSASGDLGNTAGAGGSDGGSALPGGATNAASGSTGSVGRSGRGGASGLAGLAPIGALRGKRGGALAAVGLAGLGLLAVLAEADRRAINRARRSAAAFED